jgi:hypothetical protein
MDNYLIVKQEVNMALAQTIDLQESEAALKNKQHSKIRIQHEIDDIDSPKDCRSRMQKESSTSHVGP